MTGPMTGPMTGAAAAGESETPVAGGEQHPPRAVRGGVDQRVRCAAQRRRLSGVCEDVREGAARA
eukprot:CAMPEP_0172184400 /NCGR_PEP_ID=MMETSP1050-20130122/19556_1 /TAXON_ID=233186 /ORGANISM="Cryptomonas curvata, Strain CCAP979/52" /LENGTH=64 /DNA_ID=CAMNT_0012858197 /DNA_START=310 /DNA_END=501 /DNA_ORIENTATION=-